MSQTNTKQCQDTRRGGLSHGDSRSTQNWNSGRGGWGQDPGSRGCVDCRNDCRNNLIAKCAFERKMKDGPISKLIITKTEHHPTQYNKTVDTLPVLCTDKNYQCLNEVVQTENDLVEADFMLLYLDTIHWSTMYHVQISTVNPMDVSQADGSCPPRLKILEQTHVFDANLTKEYYQNTSGIPRSNLKSTPNSLPTRRF